MLICPKCSKTFEDGSKICRDCGAILNPLEVPQQEEMPTDFAEESVFADDQPKEEVRENQWEQAPWQCPTCKETIEPNFEACWNCGTNRNGRQDPGFVSERTEAEGAEPAPLSRPLHQIPHGDPCRKCGSVKVIPNAILGDQGQYSDGHLKAKVIGNPEAWIFKNAEQSELQADICGECGHVELRVTNPGLLYQHYLRTLEEM